MIKMMKLVYIVFMSEVLEGGKLKKFERELKLKRLIDDENQKRFCK